MNMQRPMPGLDAHLTHNPDAAYADYLDALGEKVEERLMDMTPAELCEFFNFDTHDIFYLATGQTTKFNYLERMGYEAAAAKLGIEA